MMVIHFSRFIGFSGLDKMRKASFLQEKEILESRDPALLPT